LIQSKEYDQIQSSAPCSKWSPCVNRKKTDVIRTSAFSKLYGGQDRCAIAEKAVALFERTRRCDSLRARQDVFDRSSERMMLRIRSCTSVGTTGAARLNTTADCQAFVGELVDDREHAESAAVMGAIPNEVGRPHVSPYRFQIRPTRPSLTDLPAWRTRAAISRRYAGATATAIHPDALMNAGQYEAVSRQAPTSVSNIALTTWRSG
jgi:hypothetical protein